MFAPVGLAGGCGALLLFGPRPVSLTARLVAGKSLKLEDCISTGIWWAAIFGLVAGLALMATVRWWGNTEPVILNPLAKKPLPSRSWWITLGFILLIAGVLRVPRMDLSLWGDEEWAMRPYVVGEYHIKKDGERVFEPVPWSKTFFGNRKANNHILQTVASRLAMDAWRAATHAKPWEFSETMLRLAPFLAGIASFAVVALLLAEWGEPVAGLLAALWLAVHPWHLRYSTEGRGYSFILLAVPLLILVTARAVESGKWRWWATSALALFFTFGSWIGSLYLAVLASLVVAGWIGVEIARGRATAGLAWRWLVSWTTASVAVVFLLAPSIPQIFHEVGRNSIFRGKMTHLWLWDTASLFISGMLWGNPEHGNPVCYTLPKVCHLPHWGCGLLAITVLIAILGGAWMLARRAGVGRAALLISTLLAAFACYFHNRASGNYLFPWYFIFALPVVAMLLATGLVGMLGTKRGKVAGIITCGLVVAYAFAVAPQIYALQLYPIEDLRQAAALTRGMQSGKKRKETVVVFRDVLAYDWMADTHVLEGPKLRELAERCRRAGCDLDVLIGLYPICKAADPELVKVAEDRTLFIPGPVLWGHDGRYTIRIFRLRRSLEPHAPAG